MKHRTFRQFEKKSRRARRGTWTRLFVFSAACAASTALVSPAAAQGPGTQQVAATRTADAAGRLAFQIAAGSLDSVFAEFTRATGMKVVLAEPTLGMIQSPGVTGRLTPAEAMDQLLAGTSVRAAFASDGTITVDVRGVTEFVEVTGATVRLASPKYTEPLREVPQTINVIQRDVIEQQGATTLRDVLRNVVGITVQAGEGGVPAGDNLTIRGFSARTDMFIDGVRDFGGYARDAFNLEQVEVAKGPSSVISGRGSTGGAINQVSKAPHMEPSYAVTLGGGTADYVRSTADVNHPIGDNAGMRVNLMWTDADVPGRDAVTSGRWGVAPAFAWGLAGATPVTVSHLHLSQDNIPDYGLPWVPVNTNPQLAAYSNGRPPVDSSSYYGILDRDFEQTTTDVATVQVDHRVGNRLSLRNLTRYGRNDRDSVITAPRFASVNTSTTLNRQLQSRDMVDTIATNQTGAQLRFATGPVVHAVSTGVEFARETSENFARTGPATPQTDLFNPTPDDPYPGPIVRTGASAYGTANSAAAFLFDTVNLGSRWEVSGGVRWDRFDVDADSTAVGGVVTSRGRVDRMTSWRGGVVYKPAVNGTVYTGYGTSLNPSAEGLSLSAATVALEPEKTRNYEIGTKWDFAGGRLATTAAVFQTEKTNARTPGVNPGDPPTVLAGEQRVRGIEVGASGHVTRQWTLLSGYAFMASKIEASNTAAEVDNALALTPAHTFNIWTTYALPFNVSVGGGVQFMDAVFRNATNTTDVPSYGLVNALVSYAVNDQLTLRVNGQNLGNVDYVDRIGGGHYVPGPRRQIMLTSDFRF